MASVLWRCMGIVWYLINHGTDKSFSSLSSINIVILTLELFTKNIDLFTFLTIFAFEAFFSAIFSLWSNGININILPIADGWYSCWYPYRTFTSKSLWNGIPTLSLFTSSSWHYCWINLSSESCKRPNWWPKLFKIVNRTSMHHLNTETYCIMSTLYERQR